MSFDDEIKKFLQEPDIEGVYDLSDFEFNLTRLTFFDAVADGVTPFPKEDILQTTSLKKVLGEVYFDIDDGVLVVVQSVAKVADDLFVNEDGNLFSVEKTEETVPELIADEKE